MSPARQLPSVPARGPTKLRTRLTVAVALVATFAIAAAMLAIRVGLASRMESSLNRDQQNRVTRIAQSLATTRELPPEEPFAQAFILDGFGRWSFLSKTKALDGVQLLNKTQLELASTQALRQDLQIDALGGRARLLAQPKKVVSVDVVIVVGSSLTELDRTRDVLLVGLLFGGGALIALSAVGAWLLAGAVLRPVQRMTDEAAGIATSATGGTLRRRLELPRSGDEIAYLGATFNNLLDQVENAVQRERHFVDDASHELRTPLAILRGELELAASEASDPAIANDPARTSALLARLTTEVERLGRLAEDLLVLARARAEQGVPVGAGVDLLSLATRVAGRLPRRGRSRSPIDVDGDAISVNWRADHAERVLTNLLDNATRFAHSRVNVHIREGLDDDGRKCALIIVSDDGPGFSNEFLPHAFERFAIADRARTRSGTGLGLAIVSELTEAAEGSVRAGHSNLGGAEVTVFVPLPAQLLPPAPAEPEVERSAAARTVAAVSSLVGERRRA
jgi:two-component system, OmpR family, sensor kinase